MPDRPRVLLLGDSIRLSYQPRVAELLADEFEVVGPTDNGRFALYTSTRLPAYIAECGEPDIVHWNNGIWDCGINIERGPHQFSIHDYVLNLLTIADHLRDNFEAQVLFATMTPIKPVDVLARSGPWTWKRKEMHQYNARAVELMAELSIPVNDLWWVIDADREQYLADDELHLSDQGIEAAAQQVAAFIREHGRSGVASTNE